jgi:restriction endonuclease S subunit
MNFIPYAHFNRLGSGKIRRGDLLFCLRGSLGKFAVVDNLDEGAIASSLVIVRPSNSLLPDFLARFFESDLCSDQIHAFANGAAQPNLSGKSLAAFQIPLPPLDEQRRIVAVLDEAFEGLSRARANAEANLADARNLVRAFAQERLRLSEADGSALGDICEIYQPQTISTKDMRPDAEFVVYGANGPIGRYHRFNHEQPQLLVTCRGATCGSVNVSEPFSWITGNAMVVRPKTEALNVRYLETFFRYAADFRPVITGSAQPQITRTSLAPMRVPIPKTDSQSKLVELISDIEANTNVLQDDCAQQISELDTLRQSLLQKAFSGELT